MQVEYLTKYGFLKAFLRAGIGQAFTADNNGNYYVREFGGYVVQYRTPESDEVRPQFIRLSALTAYVQRACLSLKYLPSSLRLKWRHSRQ